MKATLKVNTKAFDKNMDKLLKRVDRRATEAVMKGSQCVLNESQKIVPRDTGTLASTAAITVAKDSNGSQSTVSYGQEDAFNFKTKAFVSEYMFGVVEDPETGTDFMLQAVTSKQDEVLKIFDKSMEDAING